MALSRVSEQFLKVFPTGCKILSSSFAHMPDSPYWHKIFPDFRIRDFDEIPTVGPVFEEYRRFKIHEVYHRWVKEVGHVVKELRPDGGCCIHIYHKDDFSTVYSNDGQYPLRRSHEIIARYRRDRPHLYNSVGLGPGLGAEWAHLRRFLPHGIISGIYLPFRYDLEDVMDDFIDLVRTKLDENGEVEILPLLFRWAFESIGVVALNRRLNALCKAGNEEANNLIDAAILTNEIVCVSNVGDFEEQYKRLIPAQDYFASVIMAYVAEAALEPEGKCIVNKLLEQDCDYKDITTLIIDLFQGAITTVPLTLTWALYLLTRCPDMIQRSAREELMKMLPSKDHRYYLYTDSLDEAKRSLDRAGVIPHVVAIEKETLRLSPPVIGSGRINSKDLVLGGYLVPAGNMIVLQNRAACRLEEYFAHPLEFLPDRYIHAEKYFSKGNIDKPFGGGPRSCMGQSFAHAQMIMALSKILRNFEVSYHHEDVGVINRLHNEPDRPVFLKLKPVEK
ncbi:probable cytochrome P450 12e1, mitochondrial [Nephila pilipes]|uniref:Probable cytochrome P450 12e1, mitochondrial n=1 Tax=Nephila pilipes TaxID=299642 RepID=A0A8X6QV09_NEPPI|nr:probable cytochrome P450 12e1, mitochondrial [Nephila pilipes]